jgi:hypothetical protein
MANNYTKASFTLAVLPAEAEVLRRVPDALEILGERALDPAERAARFADLGSAFAECFPPSEADPFEGFLDIFSDGDYPCLGFELVVDPPGEGETIGIWIYGEQVDIDTAAALIKGTAKSALPFGFEYALDCDRLRPGEFGGGYVVIRDDGIEFGGSAPGLERALSRSRAHAERALVMAIRDGDEGLLFWNNASGFGALANATIFSEAEAVACDLPIAADQPEWLALPVPAA